MATPPDGGSTGAHASTGATSGAGAAPDSGLDLLIAERDELLGLLARARADHANGDLDDVDAEALIDDYTARAAEVLRRINDLEAGGKAPGANATRGTTPRGSSSSGKSSGKNSTGAKAANQTADASGKTSRRTLVWVVAVVAFALLAGVLVAQSAGRRGAGETFTGDIRQTTRDLLLTARDQTAAGEFDQALATYDEVLAIAPTNPEALTYSAWIGRTMARSLDDEAALELLDDALASDPSYADARVFKAIILRDLGRYDEALAEIDRLDPEGVPEFMVAQVESLRTEVSGADPDRVAVVRAEAAALRGDFAEAVRILDEVLARSPDNAGALIAKADVLLVVASGATGEDRDLLVGNALNLVERARVAAPLDPTPLLYRALILELLGRPGEALETLDLLDAASLTDPALADEVDQLRQRLTR
jgi:tetratricopeptide (TPR) repeat protein